MLWVLNSVIHRRGKIQTRGARLEVSTVVTGKGAGLLCFVLGWVVETGGNSEQCAASIFKLRDGELQSWCGIMQTAQHSVHLMGWTDSNG